MMAIISKLQFALVGFLLSLFVDPSEAGPRGIFRIFEDNPVWTGKLPILNK